MSDAPHPWQDPESKEIHVDYCIIGGGISGLYSAVRLSQVEGGEPPKICILEATHRVGGRVVTIDIPGTSLYADLGAMRFLQTQPLIGAVVEHYGLETYDYDFPTDFYYVRGRRTELRPGQPDTEQAYHSLREKEIGKEPGMLVIHAIAEALQEIRVVEPGSVESTQIELLADTDYLNHRLEGCYDRVMKKGFLAFSPKEWRTIKLLGKYPTSAGLYLYQLGFWDVVQSRLSSEAYSLVDEGLGYQTIIGTWNAADAIPWFLADFSELPYKSIKGGMGEIPRRLYLSFLEAMSRRREMNPLDPAWVVLQRARVKKVSWQEDSNSVVVNADLDVEGGLTTGCTVRAQHCLVCVSRGALKKIDFTSTTRDGNDEINLKKRSVLKPASGASVISEHYLEQRHTKLLGNIVNEYTGDLRLYTFEWLLECVERQPLLKMFLAFKHPWWEKVRQRMEDPSKIPAQGFKVFTNLPLRQLFYHGSNSSSRTGIAKDRPEAETANGMIMAYCDAKHASYWDALAFQERKRYASNRLEAAIVKAEEIGGMRGNARRDLAEFGVSRHLAGRAHEQIWRVHRGLIKSDDLTPDAKEVSAFTFDETGKREEIARSETVLFMNWMKAPFYGGWHAWRIGVVSDDVKTIWERPWMDTNIYFAGEVVSSDQGWSEGALRSVERIIVHQMKRLGPRWEKKHGARAEDVEQVDVNKKAKELGFGGIEEYIDW